MKLARRSDRYPGDPTIPNTLMEIPFVDIGDDRIGGGISEGRLKVISPHHEGTHLDLPDHVFPSKKTLKWFEDRNYLDKRPALLVYAPQAEQVVLDTLPWGEIQRVMKVCQPNKLLIITEHGLKSGPNYFTNIPSLPDLEDVLSYFPKCKIVGVDAPSHDPEYAFLTKDHLKYGIAGRTLNKTRALLEQDILPLSSLVYGSNFYYGKQLHKFIDKKKELRLDYFAALHRLALDGPGIYLAEIDIRPFYEDRFATDGVRVRTALRNLVAQAHFTHTEFNLDARASEALAALCN